MVNLLKQKNVLIAVASFLLIWYVVVHRKVSEPMTGAARASEADKKAIADTIIQTILPPPKDVKPPELTAEAKKQIDFLLQNPLTAIDDKFMSKLTEIAKTVSQNDFFIRKLMEDPDFVKKATRGITQLVTAHAIWAYADTYEKLKEAPTQSEFKEQMSRLFLDDPKFRPIIDGLKINLTQEPEIVKRIAEVEARKKQSNDLWAAQPAFVRQHFPQSHANQQAELERQLSQNKLGLDMITVQKSALGENNYPLSGSMSPLVNQIFDITYRYYFGETYTASSIVNGAWIAMVATFGSMGAIAVVGAVVYFVFLR
jgi:hypothetical protein